MIDDLSVEHADKGGNLASLLDEIIDTYYGDQRPLIITTNADKDAFKARYGQRIESRIRECHGRGGGWAVVSAPDWRGR